MFPFTLTAALQFLPPGIHFGLSIAAGVVGVLLYVVIGDQDAFGDDLPPNKNHAAAVFIIGMALSVWPAMVGHLQAPWWDAVARVQLLLAFAVLPVAADKNRWLAFLLLFGAAVWLGVVRWYGSPL